MDKKKVKEGGTGRTTTEKCMYCYMTQHSRIQTLLTHQTGEGYLQKWAGCSSSAACPGVSASLGVHLCQQRLLVSQAVPLTR